MDALQVNIYVTSECNRRCPECYYPKGDKKMSFSMAKKVGDWISDLFWSEQVLQFHIHFLGGEPLSNPSSIFMIEDTIMEKKPKWTKPDPIGAFVVFTNGDYLDGNLEKLKSRHIYLMLNPSYDSLNVIEEKILKIKNVLGGCSLAISLDDLNMARLPQLAELVVKHKCGIRVNRLYDGGLREGYVEKYTKQMSKMFDILLGAEKPTWPNFIMESTWVTWDSPKNPNACLAGDTKISLLNGTEMPLADLVDKKNFWIYSCTKDGKIVPGKVKEVWKTGNKQVIKITLDNEESFKCTEDHLLMLRDGSYKPTKDCLDESLMPLYRKVNKKGYEYFKSNYVNPNKGTWKNWDWWPTYRMVNSYFEGPLIKGQVIHHKEIGNIKNNDPGNLIRLTDEEHRKIHCEFNKNVSSRNKRMWQDPIYRKKMLKVLEDTRTKIAYKWENDSEFIKEHLKMNRENGKSGGRPKLLKINIIKRQFPYYGKNNPNYKHGKYCQNHKIISIENIGCEDVFDLEVEGFHNFAIMAGIFVHNCGRWFLVIDPDGSIRSCNADMSTKIGHIDTHKKMEDFKFTHRWSAKNLPECQNCEWVTWCQGGCPYTRKLSFGDYNHKSPFCEAFKTLFPRLIQLKEKWEFYQKRKCI